MSGSWDPNMLRSTSSAMFTEPLALKKIPVRSLMFTSARSAASRAPSAT